MRIPKAVYSVLLTSSFGLHRSALSPVFSEPVVVTSQGTPLELSCKIQPHYSSSFSFPWSNRKLHKVRHFGISDARGDVNVGHPPFHCRRISNSSFVGVGAKRLSNTCTSLRPTMSPSVKSKDNKGPTVHNEMRSSAGSCTWHRGLVDKRRIRCLTEGLREPSKSGRSVVCFLQRDLRLDDNWALVLAQVKELMSPSERDI